MVDLIFEHPRLAAIYDALDPDRSDLLVYAALVEELGSRSVLDVGCGTGTLALLLADRGVAVTGLDPAAASLAVARCKPGADRVTWLQGEASELPPLQVDLAVMTGNAAQAITDQRAWEGTLRGVHDALRPGGRLVLETRVPARRAWERWTRAATLRTTHVDGVGAVRSWVEVTAVRGPLVSFRWTFEFAADGATLVSDSTLRFRERDEVEVDLRARGFAVQDVRDAPDRPGQEYVVIARRGA
jgi:SAM-dependent methyltransferase